MHGPFPIDFGEPIPLFPLPMVVLYPHTMLPLHIFERRYRQMVEDALDHEPLADGRVGPPIAMAMKVTAPTAEGCFAETRLRPVVCVGHIVHDETFPDGRHNILVHGTSRAEIVSIEESPQEQLYLKAMLRQLEPPVGESPSPVVRDALRRLLAGERLSRMHAAEAVCSWVDQDDIPLETLLEKISFALIKDEEVRYRLLAEPDCRARARIIHGELERIDRLVSIGDRQNWREWPRHLSWN